MGVYIKGMEMPDSCDACKFSDWSNLHQTACCKILEYKPCFSDFSSEYETRISDLCPLVEVPEPHGRLIEKPDVSEYEVFDEDSGTKGMSLLGLMECYRMVEDAQTVIKAEGE